MIEILFSNISLSRIFEFVAALVATFSYFFVKRSKTKVFKYLLIFLWLTVITEFLGSYTRLIDPYCLEDIQFFKDYPSFIKNYWVYNIYIALAIIFYTWYFFRQLSSKKSKNRILYAIAIFTAITLFDFFFGDIFFVGYSQLMQLSGLIIIVAVLCLYYYEILNSDRILSIHTSNPFYISIGVLVYYISVTPLFLSSQYFIAKEIVFLEYYDLILYYANYFLYGMIIFGIVKCYWFNKSQSTKSLSSSTSLS